MDDTISRKAVIDGLWKLDIETRPSWLNAVLKMVNELSSAQPEIIRCKDCKHHWTHKCMDSMPNERCELEQTFYDAEIDYCSLAEKRADE